MRIVVDANIFVALTVPTDYSPAVREKFGQWTATDMELFAPVLWRYEATTAIRKYVAGRQLTLEEGLEALAKVLSFEVREVNLSLQLLQGALGWADRIQQVAAYDSAYLALAQQLGAGFWTADGRLARKARAAGLDWVYDIVENT